jgi:hypothetical protein
MRKTLFAFSFALLPSFAFANDAIAHWTQLGPGGAADERTVVSADKCPAESTLRAATDASFSLVCSRALPASTPSVHTALNPQRIVVLGDTGCRIVPPKALQDCNDPASWPFPVLAASAAKLKPDLVIHVGDYLYREHPCPPGDTGCAGSPFGDNWPTWNADFFAPAAPLLAAAPWVFVRGNHEDCKRSGTGFTRLLGPLAYDPAAPCVDHFKLYGVPVGGMTLAVLDDAATPNYPVDETRVPILKADFDSLATISPTPLWLLMHEPIWGLVRGPFGIPIGGNPTLIAAVGDRTVLAPVSLQLAGHIHTFEALNYDAPQVPPEILAGHGGDNLDPAPHVLNGLKFPDSLAVKDGISIDGFGFLLMTRQGSGWNVELMKSDGTSEGHCTFGGGRVDCPIHPK